MLTYSLTYIIRYTVHFWESAGSRIACYFWLANYLCTRKTGSYCPVFCPPAGYTSRLWCYYSTCIKGFQPILFADPYKFPNSEFRTALLRLYRPLRKRLTPLLYIFRLCSQLRGSPLAWQLFLSHAPTLSCQPFPGVICMSAVLHSIDSTQHQHNPEHITSH